MKSDLFQLSVQIEKFMAHFISYFLTDFLIIIQELENAFVF
jgi:hypothetical protein